MVAVQHHHSIDPGVDWPVLTIAGDPNRRGEKRSAVLLCVGGYGKPREIHVVADMANVLDRPVGARSGRNPLLEPIEERVDRICHRGSQRERDPAAVPVDAGDERERRTAHVVKVGDGIAAVLQ